MKYKFLAVVLLLAIESVFPSAPEVPSLGVAVREFFERFSARQAVSDFKIDMNIFLGKSPAICKAPTLNGGFGDLEGVDAFPNAGAFPDAVTVKNKLDAGVNRIKIAYKDAIGKNSTTDPNLGSTFTKKEQQSLWEKI